MEKPDSRMSDRRSSTGDSALRPAASSTLAVYSQTELQASSRREGTRPPTSSTSSQSGTQPEWDTNRLSFYGSRATVGFDPQRVKGPGQVDRTQTSSDIDDLNLEPNEIWPPSDSEDDSGGDGKGGTTLKR